MLQRQISVVISLPMIVQLGKTLLLLKRSADYALGVVYHVKQQHFNPHPTSRAGATSWMILYPLIPHYSGTFPQGHFPGNFPPNGMMANNVPMTHFSPEAFSQEYSWEQQTLRALPVLM
jgi:hypothetical protein